MNNEKFKSYLKEQNLLSDNNCMVIEINSLSSYIPFVGAVNAVTKNLLYVTTTDNDMCIFRIKNFLKFDGIDKQSLIRIPFSKIKVYKYTEKNGIFLQGTLR